MSEESPKCGAQQPGNRRTCILDSGHGGQHESWLTPGRTRNYWFGDTYPVKYRVVTDTERAEWLNAIPDGSF